MSKQKRRHHSPEQKGRLLRQHLVEKIPVSQICNENELQPSVFYGWLQQLLERASSAFTAPAGPTNREQQLEAKVAALEARLAKRDNVIAEITADYVQLKKELGEL